MFMRKFEKKKTTLVRDFKGKNADKVQKAMACQNANEKGIEWPS